VSIQFKLKEEITPYGPLLTPLVRLAFNTVRGWQDGWFLIDTGADFTTVPESVADLVGIDLSRCPKEFVIGIDGRSTPVRVGSLTLQIGKHVSPVRCHFLKADHGAYLLGRMDVFSRFDINFKNRKHRVIFSH